MFTLTISIIVLTCIISITGFNNPKIIDDLIFWPPAITTRHQYYRFISCGFIHANYTHLAFNMFTMYFFGKIMEAWYMGILGLPNYYFLILYLGALVFSLVPTYIKHRLDYDYRSLGASGAVSAILFAFILLRPWQTIYVFFIPIPAIIYGVLFLGYSVYMARKGGDFINHDAHFYGALFGIIFTIAVKPAVVNIFVNELSHPRFQF
ncbi:MAG TPA: rhomboid family intramembrane serine protease [Puia sp.]|jgi:membrane associated rhomboid family serine protease|nr:rhomboid family intramembrane serine protease [Puia sp.]